MNFDQKKLIDQRTQSTRQRTTEKNSINFEKIENQTSFINNKNLQNIKNSITLKTNPISTKNRLKRSRSCQIQLEIIKFLDNDYKNEHTKIKSKWSQQIVLARNQNNIFSDQNEENEQILFQNDNFIPQPKTLQLRKKQKITFINDKISQLQSITTQLKILKGQILMNLESQRPLKIQKLQRKESYYIYDLLKNRNASDSILKMNSAHFKHFSLNFKILKSLEKQHSLISRPFSCKKIVKNPNMIIQELPTLVLDLDETLIWTEKTDKPIAKNIIYLRDEQGNKNIRHEVILRPFLHKFLEQASKLFEIIVFTAGTYEYTSQVLKFIDPQRCYIARVLTKEHTTKFQGKYEGRIKDLRVLGRNLQKTVFVDNNIFSYTLQLENGVPIIPFQGDATDEELLKLLEYLKELQKEENFMAKNESIFKQSKLRNYFNRNGNVENFLKQLYPH